MSRSRRLTLENQGFNQRSFGTARGAKIENFSQKDAGFTLIELLVYIGILVAVTSLGTIVFFSTSRSYLQNQARAEVSQNLRVASQLIQQAIQQAARVNQATTSLLQLQMADPTATTTFSLSAGVIYKQEGTGPQVAITSGKVNVTALNFSSAVTQVTVPDNINHWAWNGDGAGWIDFNPPLGHVRLPIGQGELFGYAYIPSLDSYISLNCDTTSSCSGVSYKVTSTADGVLSGYAWNDAYGWISFNCNDAGLPSGACTSGGNYKVTISSSTGDFMGWAWSENLGWISFNSANPELTGTTTAAYKVSASKRQGVPTTGVQVTISIAYNDLGNALLKYSDSLTFTVVLAQPSGVTLTTPQSWSYPTGTVTPGLTINGAGFRFGATVKLSRSGFSDVFPSTPFDFISSTSLQNGAFDLTNVAAGNWNVVVINPDGEIGLCPQCFTVTP